MSFWKTSIREVLARWLTPEQALFRFGGERVSENATAVADGSPNIEQQLTEIQQRLAENRERLRNWQRGRALWPRIAGWGAVVLLVSVVLVSAPSLRHWRTHKIGIASPLPTRPIRWLSPPTTAKAKSWLMRFWPTATIRSGASIDTARRDLRVYFDFDRATLRPESEPVLKEISDILASHPDWKLDVAGHTDDIGPDDYNLGLSNRRAAAVKKALVENYHVDSERLITRGFGATRPAGSNNTKTGRARNRRTEMVPADDDTATNKIDQWR
jgi:outer membrane protein OmpA-like peptidoglycan-associated protein